MVLFYNHSKSESISDNCQAPEAKDCKYKTYYACNDQCDVPLLKERHIEDVIRVLGIDIELHLLRIGGLEPSLGIFIKKSLMEDTHIVELEYGSSYYIDPVPVVSVPAVAT